MSFRLGTVCNLKDKIWPTNIYKIYYGLHVKIMLQEVSKSETKTLSRIVYYGRVDILTYLRAAERESRDLIASSIVDFRRLQLDQRTSRNLLHEDPDCDTLSFTAQITDDVLVLQPLMQCYFFYQVLDL